MATELERLISRLEVDLGDFKKEFDRAGKITDDFKKKSESAFKGIGSSVKEFGNKLIGIKSAIVAVAGAAGLGYLIKSSVDAAGAIEDTADRIGIGIEALQELQFAAEQSGVEIGTFNSAVTSMVRRSAEAVAGNKAYADGFKSIGVSVKDLRALRPEEIFNKVADGIDRLPDIASKVNAADKIFSNAGRQLVNLFRGGSDEINRMRVQAQKLGLVLSHDMVRAAGKAGDELDIMGKALKTQLTTAVLALTPQILLLGQAFQQAIPYVVGFVQSLLPLQFQSVDAIKGKIKALGDEIDVLREKEAKFQAGQFLKFFTSGNFKAGIEERIQQQKELNAILEERAVQQKAIEAAFAGAGGVGVAATGTEPTKTLAEVRKELEFELAQLKRNAQQQELYNQAKAAGLTVNKEFTNTLLPLIQSIETETKAVEKAAEAKAKHEEIEAALIQRSADVTASVLTEADAYNLLVIELGELRELFISSGGKAGITEDTFTKAMKNAREGLSFFKDEVEETNKVTEELGFTFESALENALVAGADFRAILAGIWQDLLRIYIRMSIIEPLAKRLFGQSSGGTGSGLFGTLLQVAGSYLGGLFGGGPTNGAPGLVGPVQPSAKGNVFKFAGGGITSGPMKFPMARGVGIAGEAGAEGIFPLRRNARGELGVMSSGGQRDVQINIYSSGGGQADVKKENSIDLEKITIMIDQAVANNVRPGTKTFKAFQGAFGAKQQVVQR